MKIRCTVEGCDLYEEYRTISGLKITCSRCDHEVEVFGTGLDSARRGAVMLREECPQNENNFYEIDPIYADGDY